MLKKEHIVIAGGGPAGLTAAIYAARSGYSPLVVEGMAPGGQLVSTGLVENFPGFPDGVQGSDLMTAIRAQAENSGARIITDAVDRIKKTADGFELDLMFGDTIFTEALIAAPGSEARRLGLESEAKFYGRGVSACAVCDGPFFKGGNVIVVGGGDSALSNAIYLSAICKSVTIVHRRDEFRGVKALADRVEAADNINVAWNSIPVEILGSEDGKRVVGLRIKDKLSGEERDIPAEGVFVSIGHLPATGWLKDVIDLDKSGYINADRFGATSVPGLFAAGDAIAGAVKQAVVAAASGCAAALTAVSFLEGLGAKRE